MMTYNKQVEPIVGRQIGEKVTYESLASVAMSTKKSGNAVVYGGMAEITGIDCTGQW